jgi:hypothetical protein
VTLPAVLASTFKPSGVAAGADGSLEVDEGSLPPPHATMNAASVTGARTPRVRLPARQRGMLTQTIRECIELS